MYLNMFSIILFSFSKNRNLTTFQMLGTQSKIVKLKMKSLSVELNQYPECKHCVDKYSE